MIDLKLQIIILVGLLAVLTIMIVHIKKKKLDFKFCLPWLLLMI